MKTEDRRVCPSCGNEFSGAVEFCPVCMLHGALAGDVESGESSSEGVIKPKSQGVARRFQHYELLIGEDGRPVELGRGAMGVTYKAFDVFDLFSQSKPTTLDFQIADILIEQFALAWP